MESFFRYIAYVDYYKKGERIRNVGFLRWKLYNEEHLIEMQLKDVFQQQGTFEIKEKNTGKKIGEIVIDKGIGSFVKKFPNMTASDEMYIDIFDERLYIEDVEGFVIWLDSNNYLSVPVKLNEVKEIPFSKDKLIEKKLPVLNEGGVILKDEAVEKRKTDDEKNINVQETEAASENILIEGNEEKYEESVYVKKRNYDEDTKIERVLEDKKELIKDKMIKIIEPIHEDKWKQLCKEYPNVHPFPNHKVFLSIKPEDFIILQQKYQKLVHNSFLLHGFYNYGYMILGKLSEEEKAPVYIGVPGVYYEREKQAAQMFGFVGFESTEHPVQTGSYGYYMIEVEI